MCIRDRDALTVAEELKKRGSLDMVGGRAYVASLSSGTPTTSNAQMCIRDRDYTAGINAGTVCDRIPVYRQPYRAAAQNKR